MGLFVSAYSMWLVQAVGICKKSLESVGRCCLVVESSKGSRAPQRVCRGYLEGILKVLHEGLYVMPCLPSAACLM